MPTNNITQKEEAYLYVISTKLAHTIARSTWMKYRDNDNLLHSLIEAQFEYRIALNNFESIYGPMDTDIDFHI